MPVSTGKWFNRKFSFDLTPADFPLIVERLRGTPSRVEDRIKGLKSQQLTKRLQETWSIQENIGHLVDLETIWAGRLEDLLSGEKELREADLSNTKTHNANHNSKPVEEILQAFRNERGNLVSRLEQLDESGAQLSAIHPRLQQPMRTIDMAFFIAEHDDHHLARISELMREV
jgi:uncharacterized damage-inducible protein DinB